MVGRAVVVMCGRKGQERARGVALHDNLGFLRAEGCTQLIIESRSAAENGRDQKVILDHLRTVDVGSRPVYSWSTKSERLLWIADALGGAVREHLLGLDPWFHAFRDEGILTLDYRQPTR